MNSFFFQQKSLVSHLKALMMACLLSTKSTFSWGCTQWNLTLIIHNYLALNLFWLTFFFFFFYPNTLLSVLFLQVGHEWLSFVVTGKPQPISALWLQSRDLRLVKLGCNWFYRNLVLGTTKDVDPGTSPTTLHIWFSLPAIHSWTSIHTDVQAGSHSVLYTYFINNGPLEL